MKSRGKWPCTCSAYSRVLRRNTEISRPIGNQWSIYQSINCEVENRSIDREYVLNVMN